jgi:hypothetical protein
MLSKERGEGFGKEIFVFVGIEVVIMMAGAERISRREPGM